MKTLNNMIEKKVFKVLSKDSSGGLTITELVKVSKLSRDAVRIALAKLEGGKKVSLKKVGMGKLYSLKKVKK